jgi:hypothetical protein
VYYGRPGRTYPAAASGASTLKLNVGFSDAQRAWAKAGAWAASSRARLCCSCSTIASIRGWQPPQVPPAEQVRVTRDLKMKININKSSLLKTTNSK